MLHELIYTQIIAILKKLNKSRNFLYYIFNLFSSCRPTNDVSSATTAYDCDLGRADLTRSRRSAFFDNLRQIIGRHRLRVRITIREAVKYYIVRQLRAAFLRSLNFLEIVIIPITLHKLISYRISKFENITSLKISLINASIICMQMAAPIARFGKTLPIIKIES